MSSWNPFRRKSSEEQGSPASDPSEIKDPNDYGSFMQRGWAFHSRGDQDKAEADFRRAVSFSPESVDANYAMGLIMKSQDKKPEAVEYFEKAMGLIQQGKIEDEAKSAMMRRLTLAHINELKTGDWNLEDEIWHQ